jgi:ATP-dependent RNA circularization protein (DNA/RNA ligase family)
LGANLILFGEWCAAQHSLHYERLPDWFLVFDVFDRESGRFWSTRRRDEWAAGHGLASVQRLFKGHVTPAKLKAMVEEHPSSYRNGPLEGIVIRRESREWLEGRAKIVRASFTQAITDHWSRGTLVWNQIESVAPRNGAPLRSSPPVTAGRCPR